jgi:alpha/beta superfamily hydrolase
VKHHKLRIKVPAGTVETLIEVPEGEHLGLALVAHPHPLHGGSLDNKVARTLARAALACGLVAVQPNFRGVGGSDGEHDSGVGETDDLVALAQAVAPHFGNPPWTLMGFSFGAYVQHRVARRLAARQLIMVGPAVTLYAFDPPALPTTIIHGEIDELIPLAAVQQYGRQYDIPVLVVAGAGHFFHGKLRPLQAMVEELCLPSA